MKRLSQLFLGTVLFTWGASAATISLSNSEGSTSDLFNNAAIVSNSNLHSGADVRDLFGTSFSTTEPQHVLFEDSHPNGVFTVVFSTSGAVNVGGYELYLGDDSDPLSAGAANRATVRFRLFLGNGTAGPLLSDVALGSNYTSSYGGNRIKVADSFAPTIGQTFTAEFTQNSALGGLRAIELDAVAGAPEPASMSLLALGGIAVLVSRRRKA